MINVYDSAEVWRVLRVLSVPGIQYVLGSLHELPLHLLGAQDIVGSYAGLPRVDQLAPQYPLHCYVHVRRAVDVDRAENIFNKY